MRLVIIKRYRSGKLYNISASTYTSIEEVKRLKENGLDVLVIDNASKRDLTQEILGVSK
jgi:polyhydroxyalkanoate synthesis regulator protein